MTDSSFRSSMGAESSSNHADSADVVTWHALLNETKRRLEHAGCPDPEVSGRRIVEAASGFEGADLARGLLEPATVKGVARLDAMVERRIEGEPLQYVLGAWSFRMLDLLVDRRVLIPRPETEIVAERALEELRRFSDPADRQDADPLVADLGTGSGAIGLSMAVEHQRARVWLTDRSDDALAVARANLAGLGRAAARVNLAHGSWFEALRPDLRGEFAVIVSNPPYVSINDPLPAQVADWEPTEALLAGEDGLDDLRHLISQAPEWLRPEGSLVVELGETQGSRAAALARDVFTDVEVFEDLTGRTRGLVGRRPR